MLKLFFYIFISIFLFSCSGINIGSVTDKQENISSVMTEMSKNQSSDSFLPDFTLDKLHQPDMKIDFSVVFVKEITLNPDLAGGKDYDIPIVVTDRVKYYINLYAKRYPVTFQKWLNQSHQYMYIVKDIFLKHGLPLDLACLAFAESGFEVGAYSRAGAGGLWQFMETTGEIYGLRNNFWVDERRDFVKATEAAAKHLKYLHNHLDDWFLSIAAYNGGYYKVLQGMKRYNTDDFFELKRRRFLYRETEEYVPKFIALTIIYKNYLKYGFSPPNTQPLMYEKVSLNQPVNLYLLAEKFDISVNELKRLNPSLKRPITPPEDGFEIRVPYGKGKEIAIALRENSPDDFLGLKIYRAKKNESVWGIANRYDTSVNELKRLNGIRYSKIIYDRFVFVPNARLYKKEYYSDFVKEVRPYVPDVYIVKRGDNLYNIAHRFGLSLNELMRMNRGVNPRLIHPGDAIVVSRSENFDYMKTSGTKKNGKYVVKSGDTLWTIAKRFDTTVTRLMKINGLNSDMLKPGNVLVLPN